MVLGLLDVLEAYNLPGHAVVAHHYFQKVIKALDK